MSITEATYMVQDILAKYDDGWETIDSHFDKLEKLLVWEMSKPVPEVDAVKVDAHGIYFEPNGARSEDEIRQEGLDAINA